MSNVIDIVGINPNTGQEVTQHFYYKGRFDCENTERIVRTVQEFMKRSDQDARIPVEWFVFNNIDEIPKLDQQVIIPIVENTELTTNV